MQSVICTLFEGDYHHGIAALVNSLFLNGFRGTVYAGYRGGLPAWAGAQKRADGYSEVTLGEELALRFLPLTTGADLTNYKPDFMLNLWSSHASNADALFYFDPDIVVQCRWSFFEEWAGAGVAVCADAGFQMSPTHPLRHAWAQYYSPYGFEVVQQQHCYLNGGFVGVSKEYREFLTTWKRLQDLMAPAIGGLENVEIGDRTFLFQKTDQDAKRRNYGLQSTGEQRRAGRDGLSARGGGYIMSHAAGGIKPWKKNMLWTVLSRAVRPSRSDKAFVRYATFPLQPYSGWHLFLKKADIWAASALGRYLG